MLDFLLAIAIAKSDVWPAAGLFVTGVLALVAGYYTIKYVDATGMRAQLDAKDAVIETNRQTIEAFEERISSLEKTATDNKVLITELQTKLDIAVERYKTLEAYAAPEAVKRVEAKLDDILKKLHDAQS